MKCSFLKLLSKLGVPSPLGKEGSLIITLELLRSLIRMAMMMLTFIRFQTTSQCCNSQKKNI